MNKSLLIHGAWAIAAIAAFVLGSRFFPAGDHASLADSPARHQRNPDSSTPAADSPRPGRTGGNDNTAATRKTPPTLDEILAMRDPMGRVEALMNYARDLPVDEISAVLKKLRTGSTSWDPESRLLAHLLLTRWAQDDSDAALASVANRSTKEGGGDAISILASLAATDPAKAVAWLNDPDNQLARQPYFAHMLARTIGRQWALQDPDAALQWAAGLPDRQRAGAYSGIIGNLAATDPQRAASLAKELDPGDRRKPLGEIAEAWTRQSPEQAISWAESLEGDDRSAVLYSAIEAWARTAPDAAAAYVSRLPEEQQTDHVASVATTWAQSEPAAAADWLTAQPESDAKVEAMGHVMWSYTNADPDAAAAWLGEQEPGPSYDRGVTGLAKAAIHAYDDPETGANWAATIGNEQLRGRMTNHTLQQWVREDPDAARQWAAQNGVEVPTPAPARNK